MDSSVEIKVKRGEVYWVRDRNAYDSYAGRPVVIVSNDKGNETAPHITGTYTTTKQKHGIINVPIEQPRGRCFVLCNQIVTVMKEDLGNYIYTLTESEMAAVDRGLSIALSLNPQMEDDGEEKRLLEEEIASLNAQLASKKDASVEVIVERDMWKKMYEKAMDMLVRAKMSEPTVEKEPVVVEPPVVKQEPVAEDESEPTVEINTCTSLDLRRIGCSPTLIHDIIRNRPYKSCEELKALPNMTRIAYQLIQRRITCVPLVREKPKKEEPKKEPLKNVKVNVNTATPDEMANVLGMNRTLANFIRAYRNKHGKFEKLEDLLNVPRFGSGCMAKYGPRLEV